MNHIAERLTDANSFPACLFSDYLLPLRIQGLDCVLLGIMHLWSLLGGLSAIGGVTLAHGSTIEPDNFNVTSALEHLGVDVSKIPALQSFSGVQSRSTENACSVAVSEKPASIEGKGSGWTLANSNLNVSSAPA